MVKKEFVKKIAEKLDKPLVEVERIVDVLFETIKESMKNEEQIVIKEFGRFEVVEKAERIGRNPQTGEQIMIKPKKVVKFKPSSNLLG